MPAWWQRGYDCIWGENIKRVKCEIKKKWKDKRKIGINMEKNAKRAKYIGGGGGGGGGYF